MGNLEVSQNRLDLGNIYQVLLPDKAIARKLWPEANYHVCEQKSGFPSNLEIPQIWTILRHYGEIGRFPKPIRLGLLRVPLYRSLEVVNMNSLSLSNNQHSGVKFGKTKYNNFFTVSSCLPLWSI